jgi:hypothetical protein
MGRCAVIKTSAVLINRLNTSLPFFVEAYGKTLLASVKESNMGLLTAMESSRSYGHILHHHLKQDPPP